MILRWLRTRAARRRRAAALRAEAERAALMERQHREQAASLYAAALRSPFGSMPYERLTQLGHRHMCMAMACHWDAGGDHGAAHLCRMAAAHHERVAAQYAPQEAAHA